MSPLFQGAGGARGVFSKTTVWKVWTAGAQDGITRIHEGTWQLETTLQDTPFKLAVLSTEGTELTCVFVMCKNK